MDMAYLTELKVTFYLLDFMQKELESQIRLLQETSEEEAN